MDELAQHKQLQIQWLEYWLDALTHQYLSDETEPQRNAPVGDESAAVYASVYDLLVDTIETMIQFIQVQQNGTDNA